MIHSCWLLIVFAAIPGSTKTTSTLTRCFERVTRRAIDNYQPLAEYHMESTRACADYCIMAAGNGKKQETLCRSFTYNIPLRMCHLYDHDGMKVPAILYPAIGIDFYKRIDEDEICRSTAAIGNDNPNFARIGEGSTPKEEVDERFSMPPDIESISELLRNQDAPNEISTAIDGDHKVLQKKTTKGSSNLKKIIEQVSHTELCLTSSAYYVVIGNEIVRPVNGTDTVEVYNDVDQGDCANFCSSNQGPNNEDLTCNSLNYFPLTRKCELYSILAEPHGPGSLVENQDVIYAEKFCLPESVQKCQNDEIFILHVQKSLSGIPIQQTPSESITSCLRSCLNEYSCKTAVFDSTKQQCDLYKEKVSQSDGSIVETPPGFVMIENGCVENKEERRIEKAEQPQKSTASQEDTSIEWSECNFRINGVRVKVRTTESGVLETSAC